MTSRSEMTPDIAAWASLIGATFVTFYKGLAIHRNGISFYVNGFWVGTSLARAKRYIRGEG